MNFDLTDEQRLLEQSTREWAAREVAPRIQQLDREHAFDRGLLPKMASSVCWASACRAKYGGAGMDYISLGLACEELEYVDTSLRVILSVHVALNSLTLLAWGTEAQKQKYLVPQAQGTLIASYGLTEPAAGSDARGIQTTAEKTRRSLRAERREDVDLARRRRRHVSGDCLDRSGEEATAKDPSGLSAFIVERTFKGFSSGTLTQKWGILAGNTGFFKMDDVEVPEENLVGRAGRRIQDRDVRARSGPADRRGRRDGSDSRVPRRQREIRAASGKAFGVEIGQHQLVKEMIAQMESDYQASRLLWLRSAWLKNEGRRNTRETGLAKWFATVASERAASDAVQMHGANGYSDEYPVGRFYRNAKGAVIYEGTREIHKLMQADYVLGYRPRQAAALRASSVRTARSS